LLTSVKKNIHQHRKSNERNRLGKSKLSREQRNLRLHHYKFHNGELVILFFANESVYLDQLLDWNECLYFFS
jgi:hypothetical protein